MREQTTPPPELLLLGENVRSLRKTEGWSQEKLAEETDLHRTYISEVERGKRNPTLLTICKFAKAFGVEPTVFMEKIQAGAKRKSRVVKESRSPLGGTILGMTAVLSNLSAHELTLWFPVL